jgi:hypothetical protein
LKLAALQRFTYDDVVYDDPNTPSLERRACLTCVFFALASARYVAADAGLDAAASLADDLRMRSAPGDVGGAYGACRLWVGLSFPDVRLVTWTALVWTAPAVIGWCF